MLTQYCLGDVQAVMELYDVMTCGGTRGTWGAPDAVAEQVREIEDSDMSPGLKALALVQVLDNAGRIPR